MIGNSEIEAAIVDPAEDTRLIRAPYPRTLVAVVITYLAVAPFALTMLGTIPAALFAWFTICMLCGLAMCARGSSRLWVPAYLWTGRTFLLAVVGISLFQGASGKSWDALAVWERSRMTLPPPTSAELAEYRARVGVTRNDDSIQCRQQETNRNSE